MAMTHGDKFLMKVGSSFLAGALVLALSVSVIGSAVEPIKAEAIEGHLPETIYEASEIQTSEVSSPLTIRLNQDGTTDTSWSSDKAPITNEIISVVGADGVVLGVDGLDGSVIESKSVSDDGAPPAALQEGMVTEAPDGTQSQSAPAQQQQPAQAQPQKQQESVPAAMAKRTLRIKGRTIPYSDTHGWSAAPRSGAGIYYGSDSTTDGALGYFIGHNPGDFAPVMQLQVGDTVSVCDSNGNMRSYTVRDAFVILQDSYVSDTLERVGEYEHGESIILQTCYGDNVHIRIVFAY